MATSQKRPTAILVVAILLIVFGGLRAFGGCCAIGVLGMSDSIQQLQKQNPNPQPINDVELRLGEEIPGYKAVMMISLALSIITGGLELVSGIGLLKPRAWARTLAIGVSAVIILTDVVNLGYQVISVIPVRNRLLDEAMGKGPPVPFDVGGFVKASQYGGIIFGLLPTIMAVVVIVLLMRTPLTVPVDEPADRPSRADRDRPDDEDDFPPPPPSTGIREM